jgi:sugar O-acyltransferase, sialic acid O-acetyltransferase NeuD family
LKDIKKNNNFVILGGGGHCLSIIELIKRIRKFTIFGILDPNYKKIKEVDGFKVLGDESILDQLKHMGISKLAIGIGSNGKHLNRNKIFKNAKKNGFDFPILIDKSVYIPKNLKISEGSQIFSGSIINSAVNIGKISVINTGSIIEHGVSIGDNVFTGPRVTICGNAKVENDVFIGANSCILPNIKILRQTIVGACSMINKNFNTKSKLAGVPAKKIK